MTSASISDKIPFRVSSDGRRSGFARRLAGYKSGQDASRCPSRVAYSPSPEEVPSELLSRRPSELTRAVPRLGLRATDVRVEATSLLGLVRGHLVATGCPHLMTSRSYTGRTSARANFSAAPIFLHAGPSISLHSEPKRKGWDSH